MQTYLLVFDQVEAICSIGKDVMLEGSGAKLSVNHMTWLKGMYTSTVHMHVVMYTVIRVKIFSWYVYEIKIITHEFFQTKNND